MAVADLAQTLTTIPSAVWPSLVGAGIALAGVVATNWGNTKRLRVSLSHDSEEKAKERLATLRRSLYLEAVDANVRVLSYFGTLPQADLSKPGTDSPFQNAMAVGARLLLVVTQETAQIVSDLTSEYGELQLRLLSKVMPIQMLQADIDICTGRYDEMQVEIRRVLAAMTSCNESGQSHSKQFEQLKESFEFARDNAREVTSERARHWVRITGLRRQYLKEFLPELNRLNERQVHVLVQLRRELDVGGDIDVFQQMMRKQAQRAERAVEEFDRDVLAVQQEQLNE